jgi:hypothetical protein
MWAGIHPSWRFLQNLHTRARNLRSSNTTQGRSDEVEADAVQVGSERSRPIDNEQQENF